MILPTFEIGESVPKVIHQTFPSKTDYPAEIAENIRELKERNPEWEHRLYDDADIEALILKYYGAEMLKSYLRINPAYGPAKADLFRYLLMYAEGGVYLDIKSTATRPLDDVIPADAQYILSHWENEEGGSRIGWGIHAELKSERGEYQQWHIIAVKGHPFLRAVIQKVLENIEQYDIFKIGFGHVGVLRTTGPIAYTLAIENVKHLHSHHELDVTSEMGVEYSIYEQRSEKGHHHIFKSKYAKLKVPVIKPATPWAYALYLAYRIKDRWEKGKRKRMKRGQKVIPSDESG